MKAAYYQFVNFIQNMHTIWFITIFVCLVSGILLCVMNFFKAYDGKQKNFEKLGLLVLAILMFALLIYLTALRH